MFTYATILLGSIRIKYITGIIVYTPYMVYDMHICNLELSDTAVSVSCSRSDFHDMNIFHNIL